MLNSLKINVDNNIVEIEGQLVRQCLNKSFVEQQTKALTENYNVIDLAKISKIDTAGLAWLLSLVEESNLSNKVKFRNLPNELLKLSKLSGVESFLSLA